MDENRNGQKARERGNKEKQGQKKRTRKKGD
jgi:hypothetical protein